MHHQLHSSVSKFKPIFPGKVDFVFCDHIIKHLIILSLHEPLITKSRHGSNIIWRFILLSLKSKTYCQQFTFGSLFKFSNGLIVEASTISDTVARFVEAYERDKKYIWFNLFFIVCGFQDLGLLSAGN